MVGKGARHVTGEGVRLQAPKPPTAGLERRREKKAAESHPATSVRYCQHPEGCQMGFTRPGLWGAYMAGSSLTPAVQ
jgi:hypothetical protein